MIQLPDTDGKLTAYEPRKEPSVYAPGGAPLTSRIVYAAPHLVVDPFAANEPFGPAVLDWDANLAFRRHLWSHGLGVVEAMDTAQRGMGLDWHTSAELIRRTAAEAKAVDGRIAAGVWTDQLDGTEHTLEDVAAAYEEQLEVVESAGAQAVILASRHLAAVGRGPEDYAEVYGRLLRQVKQPVIVHWIGPMWDPGLTGYWGHPDMEAGMESFLSIIAEHKDKIDGIKVAPLPLDQEIELRNRVPEGVRCYTGDDMSYPQLMEGDERGYSDALVGIFDPLAPVAAAATRKLDAGDTKGFRELLDPTVELSQHLFEGPGMNIRFYKTGFVFLAWLAGHQDHFRMVWGEQAARSVPHLSRAYQLGDQLGLFPDPELAERRMKAYLTTSGIEQ